MYCCRYDRFEERTACLSSTRSALLSRSWLSVRLDRQEWKRCKGNEYLLLLIYWRSYFKVLTTVSISALFSSSEGSSPSLLVLDTTTTPPIPIPVKVGDANMDGFPDLLFITSSAPHGGFLGIGSKTEQIPRLAFSVPCSKGVAGCDTYGNGHRGFSVLQIGAEKLTSITDARGASFLDLDEDVRLNVDLNRVC